MDEEMQDDPRESPKIEIFFAEHRMVAMMRA